MNKQKKKSRGQDVEVDLKNPVFWSGLGVRLDEVAGHRIMVTDEITGRSLIFLSTDSPMEVYQYLSRSREADRICPKPLSPHSSLF